MSADPRLRARQQQQQAAPVPPPPPPPPIEVQAMGTDGANDVPAPTNVAAVSDDKFKLKFCTVCASNQNR
jgi:RNA polymerase II subunit A C-terminal domain phosphatase SSU72